MKIQNFKFAAPVFLLSSVFALSCMHKDKPREEAELNRFQNQWREIIPLSERNPSSTAEEVSWWAATEQQVQKAVCRKELPKTSREIQNYFQRKKWLDGVEPADFKVSGIDFKSERPELVYAFARLLSPVDANEEIKGIPENFQQAFKVNPACKKIFCAVQKIFGPEVGPQMLFLLNQYGVNTSPYSFVNAAVFRPDEIYDVLKTFELLGADHPFIENQKLIKFKRGYTRALYGADGDLVLANAGIELFDGWTEKSSLNRQYALYHEFAHNYANAHFQDYDNSQSWLKMSGWSGNGRDFKTNISLTLKGHPFVSKYGAANPFEDFAESVTAYRLNPSHLKKTSEKKYQFVRHLVHDGQEFTSESCQKSSRFTRAQERIIQTNFKLGDENLQKVIRSCRATYYSSLLSHLPVSVAKSCVNFETSLIWAELNQGSYPDLIPNSFFDTTYAFPRLKFPEVQKQVHQLLRAEAAQWIESALVSSNQHYAAVETNAEYCSHWSRTNMEMFPHMSSQQSAWRTANYNLAGEWYPASTGLRSMCLDLVEGWAPPQPKVPAKEEGFLAWIGFLRQKAVSTVSKPERQITREQILRYIDGRYR